MRALWENWAIHYRTRPAIPKMADLYAMEEDDRHHFPKVTDDDKADHLQKLLRNRFEVLTGYADMKKQTAEIEKRFKYYDKDNSGSLCFEEFDAALTEMNLGDAPKSELRALFDRYDSNGDENVSYPELINGVFEVAPHPLAQKESRRMLENIRAQIAKRGGLNGIRSLGRSFRIMYDGGNGKIEPEEMLYGLRDQGVEVERNEIEQIMLHFDKDGDGSVIFDEFLRALRGKMNQRRKGLVKLAFGQLDKTGDGVVTMEDLMGIYDVSENPDVINGLLTPDQAFQEFAKVWDRDRSGSVHLDEFIDYYQDVSASIDNDDYFELMIRNAWHISGGEGQYENTANLRVLVIHDDGSQEVVEIKDDLGLDVNDFPAIRKKLFMQGVKNIKKVEVASAM